MIIYYFAVLEKANAIKEYLILFHTTVLFSMCERLPVKTMIIRSITEAPLSKVRTRDDKFNNISCVWCFNMYCMVVFSKVTVKTFSTTFCTLSRLSIRATELRPVHEEDT